MGRPATPPTFAGNTNYGGADPWSGAPVKVDPGAPRRAEGYVPDHLPAEWLNFQFNIDGLWIQALAGELDILETPISQTKVFPINDFVLGRDPGTAANRWVIEGSGATGAAPRAFPTVDHAYASAKITLPEGATITKVEIMVQTSAARATPTDRWNAWLYERLWNWVPALSAPAITQIGTLQDDGGGGASALALITFSGLTQIVQADADYYARIQGPNSATASDHLLAMRVTYTAPPQF